MIRGDDDVEFPAHRANEHSIGGERTERAEFSCDRRQQLAVLGPESAAITGVRVQRAEGNARLRDVIPVLQPFACETDRIAKRGGGECGGNVAERQVRGRQHDAQRIAGEHHRRFPTRQVGEQLGVAGRVVAAKQQRMLVERRRDNAAHGARLRQLHCAHHSIAGEFAGQRLGTAWCPGPDRFLHIHFRAAWANDQQVAVITDLVVVEHRLHQLRSDAARIAQGDSEARTTPRHRERTGIRSLLRRWRNWRRRGQIGNRIALHKRRRAQAVDEASHRTLFDQLCADALAHLAH